MPDLFRKDPSDVLDFMKDWTLEMEARSDTIDTSDWTAPAGITIDDETFDDMTATVWLSGGTAGELYEVANLITTNGGRTYEKSIQIKVENL